MEEPALRQLLEIASRENAVTPQALEAYRAKSVEKAETATQRDGVGILDVTGALFKRANLFTAISGGASYDVLMRDFQALRDDGNVRAILLNVDSPGGEVGGCAELSAAIAKARGKGKPIVAYVGDLGASAAYWIASACDSIVLGASAAVGSIGVKASLTDTSERDERQGVRRFDFVSSQSPYKVSDPKTDDGTARIQARVDALAAVFVETVAANRGVPVAKVLDAFGKGDVLIGAAAVAAGMADALGTFESTLAKLSADTDPLAPNGPIPAALRGPNPPKENATMPPPAAPRPVPTALDVEFERVRAAANARHAAEQKALAAEDRAVAMALASLAGPTLAASPAEIAGSSPRASDRAAAMVIGATVPLSLSPSPNVPVGVEGDATDRTVALILSFAPQRPAAPGVTAPDAPAPDATDRAVELISSFIPFR